jgi:hypothetical protein
MMPDSLTQHPHMSAYARQEHSVAAHLIDALVAGRKETRRLYRVRRLRFELRSLRRQSRIYGLAANPYARCRWFRLSCQTLMEHLELDPADPLLQQPVYLLSLIDQAQTTDMLGSRLSDIFLEEYPEPVNIAKVAGIYEWRLGGLNSYGMLEPAFYAYLPRSARWAGERSLVVWHAHVLVWGTSVHQLSEFCQRWNRLYSSLIPGAYAADYRLIRSGDLLKVLGYLLKSPRHQYQLIHRSSVRHPIKQRKAILNGVNAVRLYWLTNQLVLDDLAIASGEGRRLLRQVKKTF